MAMYRDAFRSGVLQRSAAAAVKRLEHCDLCPRQCGVNRLQGERGICRTGRLAHVASYHLHFGEEAPLVGERGSGTIFFAGCNLGCVFCQNYDISHSVADSPEVEPRKLAAIMCELQDKGALNINFVTPSHVLPQILEALVVAADMGLEVPLVYNTSAYDCVDSLQLLENIVDIYMPDVKFWDEEPARRYCKAPDYPDRARLALVEMHRQVGDLEQDAKGSAIKGLLVRHLLMPAGVAGTAQWMRFLASEISPRTYVNIMDQYHPCGEASAYPELRQHISAAHYHEAMDAAREAGLQRLDNREARITQHLRRLLMDSDAL